MGKVEKIIQNRGAQAISASLLLMLYFTYLLHLNLIDESVYTGLFGGSIMVGCIIYFREQLQRITANIKSGELALELKQFEEDIVNTLLIKQ